MKKIILLTLLIFNFSFSQKIIKDISLSKLIDETSGLEIIDNQFITHNDSGGEPKLYYLNKKGKIISERKINGVKNNDWEDITQDDEFIYVADMGNNYDTRKNLSVIKIPRDKNSVIDPEIIKFNYPEQNDFRYKKLSQFDAEALISINEFLIIFTKNRATKKTDIYSLPKNGGEYQAKKIGSLNTQSIITGGDYDQKNELLILTSTISFDEYYILKIEDFSLKNKKDYKIEMYEIPIGKTQVEAVKIIDSNTFWITSEDEKSSSTARLMKIKL
ncbi:MAG: hypothetical protein CND00_04065 [Cryomorphaceae bacterium MED-G14]|nr:hypothetical protein [Flavobacteriaceae bacterium]PDH50861.1 MAG: hypothetical protein CND00_04065 [Cryomorphaceae bacterium MED-G14]